MKICSDNFDIILANLGLSSIAGTAPPIRQIFEEVLRQSNSRILAAQYRFCEIPRELEFGMLSICLPLKIQRILWDFLFLVFSCKLTFLKGISFVVFRAFIGSFGQRFDLKE